MIARKHVNLVRAPPENLPAAFEALGPGDLVAGGNVEIRLHVQPLFERLPIVMDVGKNQQLQ